MRVGMDRLDKARGLGAIAAAAGQAGALADVPAVVGAGRSRIDFLPVACTDVIDEELSSSIRVDGDPKRIAQAGGIDLPTGLTGRRSPGSPARLGPRAGEWVPAGDAAVAIDAQDLAVQRGERSRRLGG